MKLTILSILFFTQAISSALSQKLIEAEAGNTMGGTEKIKDDSASGRHLAALGKSGDGLLFSNLPASRK